jgi:hypothetical protein
MLLPNFHGLERYWYLSKFQQGQFITTTLQDPHVASLTVQYLFSNRSKNMRV